MDGEEKVVASLIASAVMCIITGIIAGVMYSSSTTVACKETAKECISEKRPDCAQIIDACYKQGSK